MIYVMGDGCVLESGTHTELLEKGTAYTRLVETQRLREAPDFPDSDEWLNKSIQEDLLLTTAANHGPRLANVAAKEDVHITTQMDEDYGLFYIFKRMIPLSRKQWSRYTTAAILACSKFIALFLS